jgi:hypothetical protein
MPSLTLGNTLITSTGVQLNYLNTSTSDIQSQLNGKQSTLVSGTNIKTINSVPILGTGNMVIGTGGTMVYPGIGIALSTGSTWGTSITDNSANWNAAYTDRLKWDGGATGLTAATGRISLGGTTAGIAFFTLTNPSAITFPRINTDNSITALSAANFKTALSLSATDVSLGNVTNESKSTMFNSAALTNAPTAPTATTGTNTTQIATTAFVLANSSTTYNARVDSIVKALKDTTAITQLPSGVTTDAVLVSYNGTIYYQIPTSSYPIYYVSNAGSDAADGLTTTTSWQTIAKVNGLTFSSGTKIAFKKGDIWREALTVPSSGTFVNYITFGTYGIGNAPKILGSTLLTAWTSDGSYIWHSTATVTDPYALRDPGNTYFKETNGNISWGKVKVANRAALASEYQWEWESNHIYIYSPTDPNTRYSGVEVAQRSDDVLLNNQNYITFDGLEIAYSGSSGITESTSDVACDGLIIKNCEIHHIGIKGSDAAYGIQPFTHSDLLIQNNIIHDCGRRGISMNCSTINTINILIEGNTFYHGFHTCALDLATVSANIDNVIFRRNLVYEDVNETLDGVESYTDASIFSAKDAAGDITNFYIYDNIFKNIKGKGIVIQAVKSSYIYNNSFYGVNPNITNGMGQPGFVWIRDLVSGNTCYCKNNIMYNNSPVALTTLANISVLNSSAATLGINYNLYYNTLSTTALIYWNSTIYTQSQWTTYKSASSQDANSPTPADPLFTSTSDFSLQAGSPAINAGIVISGIPQTDYLGNPIVGATDIGAYEKQ